MRFIDLFSGMGGFRVALEKKSLECVFSADNDKFACETYFLNFGENPNIDITNHSEKAVPDHEILCAGFPCQPFSIAGYRRGFRDIRGTLFFDIVRILKEKKPMIFILENVKGILSHDSGKTFNTIIDFLATKLNGKEYKTKNSENLGYNVFWQTLNTRDYNLPQNRERVFIIGLKDHNIDFKFPSPQKREITLRDILDKNPEKKKISFQSQEYIDFYLKKHKDFEYLKTLDYLVAYEIRKSRVAFRYDNNSPCLTTKMGTGGNNVPYLVKQKRFFSINECLKLQGFPKKFKITNSYSASLRQIGNSVSVPIVESIIKEILS